MTKSLARPLVRSLARALAGSDGAAEPSEFITNGGFASAAGWTIDNGAWAISGGVATNGIIQSGETNFLGTTFVRPLVSGNDYVLSVLISDPNVSRLLIRLGEDQNEYDNVPGDGVLVVPFTASAAHAGVKFFAKLEAGIILDNVSLAPA